MSVTDPEVLYLILTKTSARESFYGFDAANPGPGQTPGTITSRQLAAVYERITGNRVGTRLNWATPITQLNTLLGKCKLPPLGVVFLAEGSTTDTAALAKAHATKWPPFGALKSLYTKAI